MPEKIQLDESTYSPTFGRFIVQPLEKGFGVTIGNAMRRVLLSSLPGFAVTAFKVDGVQHEFSTIPGVVEDVPDMVLNLKQVRMKLINKKTNRVVVPLKGPMDFTAGDIQKATPDVEILNPKLHIATLNTEANFELDLRIGRGVGYVVAEENKAPDQTLGVIPIDSVFTPIVNVRYFVETTRVGQQTDYEKLTIEIDTDGSIAPEDALAYAGKILRDHRKRLMDLLGRTKDIAVREDPEVKRGGCVVETDHGTIDAQLETQLQMLEAALLGDPKTRAP